MDPRLLILEVSLLLGPILNTVSVNEISPHFFIKHTRLNGNAISVLHNYYDDCIKITKITPSLRSNFLLNTGLWKLFDDYIVSTVSLSYKEAETLFRLRVTGEETTIWDSFKTWEQTSSSNESPDLT